MSRLTVVGSGTGVNYPVAAGALKALEEIKGLPDRFISSSGSGIAFSLRASGRGHDEILGILRSNVPSKLIKWRVPFTPGLFSLVNLEKVLSRNCARSFAKLDSELVVTTTDSDSGELVLFSPGLTPTVSVASAVRASASMPIVFSPKVINGRRLVDGGLIDNLHIPEPTPDDEVIAIRVISKRESFRKWRWWPSFLMNMVGMLLDRGERVHIPSGKWDRVRVINIQSSVSSIDFFSATEDTIQRLYDLGYNSVKRSFI